MSLEAGLADGQGRANAERAAASAWLFWGVVAVPVGTMMLVAGVLVGGAAARQGAAAARQGAAAARSAWQNRPSLPSFRLPFQRSAAAPSAAPEPIELLFVAAPRDPEAHDAALELLHTAARVSFESDSSEDVTDLRAEMDALN